MTRLPYTLAPDDLVPPMGLIVLSTDETLEPEFAHHFADRPAPIYVSRIASTPDVTPDNLAQMKTALPAAADLLPKARAYRVVGYGCTSASSIIGSETVEALVQQTCQAKSVTNPLRATVAQAEHLGVSNLALISPYVEDVNEPLRRAFASVGIATDTFATFAEASEANVVRISTDSIVNAAINLGADPAIEAVFLSCTNLRTLAAVPEIRNALGKPVMSSNQSLAWHMRRLNAA